MRWDAHTTITSPSVVSATVGDSPTSNGFVNRHPVYFTEGNVANLGAPPSRSVSTPLAADLIPALPSFLGAALSWGLGESAAGDEMCNSGSPSALSGGEPLPESMQRSLRAAWTKLNWKALYRLRHAHYYTGEVAKTQGDLQSGSSKDKHGEGEWALDEVCDTSYGDQILPNAGVDSDSAESVKRTSTTLQEHTAASLTDVLYKEGLASLCTRILPSTGAKNIEKGSISNTSLRRTGDLQLHGYGVLLYIIYGYRRNVNGSTPAAPTTAATGCSTSNNDASAGNLIPLALVPKAYCPVLDLFGKEVLDADLVEMSGRTSKSMLDNEQQVSLQFMQEGREHNDKVAVLSLVTYEGSFWRGQPHGKGRLLVYQRYILEGEWVHGAPQLRCVWVLRKILAHQIDSQGIDRHGKYLDQLKKNRGKYEAYPHTSSEVEETTSPQSMIIFSEKYMGTLTVGINRRKALNPEEIARLSEPWKRQGGLSWTINPRFSFLYDGLGEALSTPGGHTQLLTRSRVAFTPHGPGSDHEGGLAMERKGIVWYCGEWVAGERHGVGAEWRSTGPNRGLYLGSYEHQQCHGPGILEQDDGNGVLFSFDRSSDCGSVFSGSWKCGVLQPTGTLLLNSKPSMSLKGTNWKFTPDQTGPGEEFLFDQAFFMKGHHSLSCIWEPIFRNFDTALGSLPPLENYLTEHLRNSNEDTVTAGFEDDSRRKRLNEYIRPILEAVMSLKEWGETLTTFQRLFYFIFGKCSRSEMCDDQKYQRPQPNEDIKIAPDTARDWRLFNRERNENGLWGKDGNVSDTNSLLKRLEQLGGSKPFDTCSLNTRHHGGRPTPHFTYSSPSWCQLMGLSTTTEAAGSLHQRGFDTHETFTCAMDKTDPVAKESAQFSSKMSGYDARRVCRVSCLHAHCTNPAYTSLSMMRGQTPDAIAERACHYAASLVTSVRLRLIPFLVLHPIECEEIMHHKVLEQFGWNVVYCLVGPLLYDLCNAVVVQQHVNFVGAYVRNGKGLDSHHLTSMVRRSLAKEQCFSFSSPTQHDMRLSDLHAAVSRLLQETNVFQCKVTQQMDPEPPPIKISGEHNSDKCLKNVGTTSSFCFDDSVKQGSMKDNEYWIPSATRKVEPSRDEETLIHHAACIFSNPALSLVVECQPTSYGPLFLWHPSSQTHQETILGSRSIYGAPLHASATLFDILDTLTALVHLSVVKYPDEPLFQQRWLGKCVLLAACKAEDMLMGSAKQETYSSPFCEEALRRVGFSPFACILLVCLITLGSVSPTLSLTTFSRLLLHDLIYRHHHHNPLQSFCGFEKKNQSITNEESVGKSESVSRITTEGPLREVLLSVLNASCRLVHCFPHLLRPIYSRNAIDDDICIYPLDELYVRAQYCASLCGSQKLLKKLLSAKKQQQISSDGISNELAEGVHAVLPPYTCYNHVFSSCTLNESTLSTVSLSGKSPSGTPLKVSEAIDSGTDGLYELKDFFKKTLRLPKETMMDHLNEYWSEKSSLQTHRRVTGSTEIEEKGTEDCILHLNLFEDQKQALMRQNAPKAGLDDEQGTYPPTSQLRTHIPNSDDASLSDFVAWTFKCVNTVLQSSGFDLSLCSNIHANTTASKAAEPVQETHCERDVYVWKHFVYGFRQHAQSTSARYYTPTRCISTSLQSLLRDEHCTGSQGQRGRAGSMREEENTEDETLARVVSTAPPNRRGSVEVVEEDTFTYPPLLSEEDFCYIALLVLFLAELDIQIELQAFFVRNDNDDEIENTETYPTLPADVDRVRTHLTPETNCIGKLENTNIHEELQCDLIRPSSQSLSGDPTTRNHESVARAPSMKAITKESICPINEAQTTTVSPPMNALRNLVIPAGKTGRNHERSHSSVTHGDPFQRISGGIQGKEFTLTLSMPSAFPYGLEIEVLESAWSTVAVMMGESAVSFRRKTQSK
ncbi:unnamed protein product [Phytomonas sp. EM1]|nr:unnamed protein product [Phytomonas sp. EM1]|eukprot:CCW64461.1 unnamed protein product [Phytomonas sp. isolate EM1]